MKSTHVTIAAVVLSAMLVCTDARAQTILFQDDWRSTPVGQAPASLHVVKGNVSTTDWNGGRYLKIDTRTDIEVVFPGILPDDLTIEFEMLVPSTHAYPVEVRAALSNEGPDYRRTNLRQERATAQCGAIAAGVYGATTQRVRSNNALAASLVPCVVRVRGREITVRFADRDPITVTPIDFGRTDRIRFTIPAIAREVALIGPITISSASPGAERVAINRGGAAPVTADPVSRPVAREPAPTPIETRTPPPTRSAPEPAATTPTAVTPAPAATTPTTVTPAPATPAPAAPPSAPVLNAPPEGSLINTAEAAADNHAKARRAAGATAAVTGAELKQQFSLVRESVVLTLLRAGYGIEQVGEWLKVDGADASAMLNIIRQADPAASAHALMAILRNTYALTWANALKEVSNAKLQMRPFIAVLKGEGVLYTQLAPVVLQLTSSWLQGVEMLQAEYNTTVAQYVEVARALNRPLPQIIQDVVDAYGATLPQALSAFRIVGVSARDALQAMLGVSALTPQNGALALKQGGYTLDQQINALLGNYQMTVESAITIFRNLAYAPVDVIVGIQRAMNAPIPALFAKAIQTGVTPEEVFAALKTLQVTPEQAGTAARQAGLTAGQVLKPMLIVFLTVPTAAGYYGAHYLINSGYTPEQTAAALRTHFDESATWVALRLKDAGVSTFGIRDALVFAFDMTVQAALGVLAGLGISD